MAALGFLQGIPHSDFLAKGGTGHPASPATGTGPRFVLAAAKARMVRQKVRLAQ